jgi:hypothetical protein
MSGQRKKRPVSSNRPQPKPAATPEITEPVVDTGVSEPELEPTASASDTASKQKVSSTRGSVKGSRQSARTRYEKNKRDLQIIKIGSAILAGILVIAIGYGVFNWAQDRNERTEPEGAIATFSYPGSEHTEGPVQYAEHPPVGGMHDSVWYTCKYYDTTIRTENAVHSLEHGAVWITFDPNLPQDQRDQIRALTEEQAYVLASPMEGLPSPVVASSWNNQIQLESASDPDLRRFIATYKQGPDTPEPGASCTGIDNPEGI